MSVLASGEQALQAVVRVGEGRGFVVEVSGFGPERYIVTAAHCLRKLPPATGASYTEERTYERLLAPLGGEPSVWCQCMFADPVADIALLGTPDNQDLWEQAEAYEELVAAAIPLAVAEPPSKAIKDDPVIQECRAFLLSLNNHWFPCTVHDPGMLWIVDAAEDIEGGMSGSPIVAENGNAIGIVCLSGGVAEDHPRDGGPNPCLMRNLPGWFLKMLARADRAAKVIAIG